MKLSIAILATAASASMKETEVQDAFFAGDDIVLSNPATRSNKQWHDCGEAPPVPANARAVECSGDKCAAVCPIGWRSQGRWKTKCQANNTWSHSCAKRNVFCKCRNGRNGDPAWKKSCDWEFRGQPWSPSDVNDVQCKTKTKYCQLDREMGFGIKYNYQKVDGAALSQETVTILHNCGSDAFCHVNLFTMTTKITDCIFSFFISDLNKIRDSEIRGID